MNVNPIDPALTVVVANTINKTSNNISYNNRCSCIHLSHLDVMDIGR